ncbi:MAG: hypothetical protein II816_03895 [Elusimicrobia bacterium]|nr:hypothetical protein [Elusimicrobiota bacterium]
MYLHEVLSDVRIHLVVAIYMVGVATGLIPSTLLLFLEEWKASKKKGKHQKD